MTTPKMFRASIYVLIIISGATTGLASAQDARFSGVTATGDGDVLVVGASSRPVMFGGDVGHPLAGPFALKLTMNGSIAWTHPSFPHSRFRPQQVGTDGAGFYITEYDNSNACQEYGSMCREPRGSVIRRDAQGVLDWTADIGAAVPGPGTFHAVMVGPRAGGGACFTALRQGPYGYGGGSRIVMGLIGPGGGFVWTYELKANFGSGSSAVSAATGDGCLFGVDLACSGGGCPGPPSTTLMLPGGYTLPFPDEHVFLARISDDGATSWARVVTGSEGRRLSLRDLRVQGDRFYIGGVIAPDWDTYLAALSFDGDVLWMREPMGNPPFPSLGHVYGLAYDRHGGVYLAGSRSVVALDSTGAERARVTFEGSLYLLDIASSADRVYAVGMGTGPVAVGGTPAELSPFWGGFVATLTSDLQLDGMNAMEGHPVPNETDTEFQSGMRLRLHPNPTRGPLTIGITLARPQRVSVEVFDVIGRSQGVVFEGVLTGGESSFRLTGWPLPSGVYICRVVGESGIAVARFSVVD